MCFWMQQCLGTIGFEPFSDETRIRGGICDSWGRNSWKVMQILAPRNGYLPLLETEIREHFARVIPANSDSVWFDYQGLPLKWYVVFLDSFEAIFCFCCLFITSSKSVLVQDLNGVLACTTGTFQLVCSMIYWLQNLKDLGILRYVWFLHKV